LKLRLNKKDINRLIKQNLPHKAKKTISLKKMKQLDGNYAQIKKTQLD